MLALPAGELSFGSAQSYTEKPEVLRAELRPVAELQMLPSRDTRDSEERITAPMEAPPAQEHSLTDGTPAPLGIPLPHYYGPREVEVRARPVREIDLEPPEVRNFPGQGKLVLLLWINESGTVDRVDIDSSEVAEALRKIIVDQFRQAAFTPAQLDGKAVKSRMKIEVVVGPSAPVPQVVPPPPPRSKPASAAEN